MSQTFQRTKLEIDIPDPGLVSPYYRDMSGMKSPVNHASFVVTKAPTLRDRLGLSYMTTNRQSITPNNVSSASCILLLENCITGLDTLKSQIPDLEDISRDISEIKNTLQARESQIENFFNIPIKKGQQAPDTPATQKAGSSPVAQHPFIRPTSESVTLEHWMYDMQKNVWYLNEKCLKYESVMTTILSQIQRKRKLKELSNKIHNSWINFILHLGLVLSQKNSDSQKKTSIDLNKLIVATGMAEVLSDLNFGDFKTLYMQGEKYLLGYGVPQSFETAFKRFDIAAQNGVAEAANMLGVMYEFGLGCKRDLKKAITYYNQAATHQDPDAINHMGRLSEAGKGCEKSLVNAFKCYKKAAQLGNVDAMTNYADCLQHGIGCTVNKELAFQFYDMAASKGYSRGQNALGTCYFQGIGVKTDYFTAIVHYKTAADQGYAPAQNNLGICYEEGRGTPTDLLEAKKMYSQASAKNHAGATNNLGYLLLLEYKYGQALDKFYLAKSLGSIDAIFHLGHLYEIGCADKNGVVISSDIPMALRFYQEAADKGHTQALLRQASILICGPECIVNLPKAIECLKVVSEMSAEKSKSIKSSETLARDTSDAQNMLGELCEMGLYSGLDGEPNYELAIDFYRRALKSGNGRAMFNLGAIYEKGEFVPRDMEKAIRLYIESDKKGDQDGKNRLLVLEQIGVISIEKES